ncbi:uncharacterized protein MELLADRAFT_88071 [Melampsora larici-populina 98AG31]|uniref:Alpha-type protein kinase domain-containing protein n=1 Tax=Melampsora larici-populina (strain 98AG31 / pathotype 3-4-7) TaxID=747676 RepID=F4RQB8_MELLP|nr:uncharacterized protein MELLADRAFT_88071 [Melampsora larici-populina 98AG31]EGG05378.1 hypothetical protein MELLADRAFT_88071 [Melampsora larici-populina 98AG31]
MPARNFDNKTSSRPVSSPATTPEVVIPNVDSADGSVVVGEVGENSDSPVLRGKEEDSSNHGRPISEDTSTTAVHFSTNCNNESSSDNQPIAKGTVVASYNVRRAPRFVRRTQPSESQDDLGPGAVFGVTIPIRTSNFRPDYPSRRAAFLYHVEDYYGDDIKPRYEPERSNGVSEFVVVFQLGRTVNLAATRDYHEWQVRELRGDQVGLLPYDGIARFHDNWSWTATSGKQQAVEIANAHMYVSQMLRRFQSRLRIMSKSGPPEVYDWYLLAKVLHVPRVSLMQTIGTLDEGLPRWMLVETARDPTSAQYVTHSCYRDTLPAADRWKALLFAFIHYAYQESGGDTLISQIDCDKWGVISNVVTFNKASYYLENSDGLDQPFFDFRGGHPCNNVCQQLGLVRLKL